MTTTLKTPEELLEILQEEDGLDECLYNLYHLDKGQQTQVRHLILDFAARALEFAPVGEESPRLAIETARLYLGDNTLKEELEEAITGAYKSAAYAADAYAVAAYKSAAYYAASAAARAARAAAYAATAADAAAYAGYAAAAVNAAAAAAAYAYAAADAAAYAVAYAAERNHQKKELKKVLESMVNAAVTT